MAEEKKIPYFLVYSAANFELRILQKGLAKPPPAELQYDRTKRENASRPEPVKHHRFRAGSVFDHINDHRQLRTTCETQF